MYSIESKSDRLILMRFEGDISEAEIKEFRSKLMGLVVRSRKPIVSCVDSRSCGALAGEAGLMIVGLMRNDNKAVERSAVVLRAGSPVTEQLQRAIEEARSPLRRSFIDAREAATWLGRVLNKDEIEALQHFLDERS